jgi:hypothetical protein
MIGPGCLARISSRHHPSKLESLNRISITLNPLALQYGSIFLAAAREAGASPSPISNIYIYIALELYTPCRGGHMGVPHVYEMSKEERTSEKRSILLEQ